MNRETIELIERVVRDQFPNDPIEVVHVKDATDADGEPIYDVTVVHGKQGLLDSRKAMGIVRHTRERLLERNDSTFPIFSFMSKADARLKTEAA
jgi:hypothetical protein